jgi:hypothetical protein
MKIISIYILVYILLLIILAFIILEFKIEIYSNWTAFFIWVVLLPIISLIITDKLIK